MSAWAAWDSNLDTCMASTYPENNSITISAINGAVCTSRNHCGGPTPDASEIAALVKFITSKQGSGLTYGGHKLMFTREIDDTILMFNIIGTHKGTLAVSKSASGNFVVFACGAGPEKNSQVVGANAIKCIEYLSKSL